MVGKWFLMELGCRKYIVGVALECNGRLVSLPPETHPNVEDEWPPGDSWLRC